MFSGAYFFFVDDRHKGNDTGENSVSSFLCFVRPQVLPLLTVTDVACMVARVASASCPDVLENESALPRDEWGIVNIPALQHHGAHSESMMDRHRTAAPLHAFLSSP